MNWVGLDWVVYSTTLIHRPFECAPCNLLQPLLPPAQLGHRQG